MECKKASLHPWSHQEIGNSSNVMSNPHKKLGKLITKNSATCCAHLQFGPKEKVSDKFGLILKKQRQENWKRISNPKTYNYLKTSNLNPYNKQNSNENDKIDVSPHLKMNFLVELVTPFQMSLNIKNSVGSTNLKP